MHDWTITAWEYDDTFFRCKRCGKETNCRRGYPDAAGCEGPGFAAPEDGPNTSNVSRPGQR